jgi:uncharacterized alkaline shock family protein YloU
MLLSSLGRRILSVLHVSPDVIAKIESTASDEVDGTSSSLGAKSTWQRGVKHSIRKRYTYGQLAEVRLPFSQGRERR